MKLKAPRIYVRFLLYGVVLVCHTVQTSRLARFAEHRLTESTAKMEDQNGDKR